LSESNLRHPIFDLDGTLIDSALGILRGVNHALLLMGIQPPEDLQELRCFIGPPLSDSFSAVYGLSDEHARLGVTYFREYYRETGVYENTPYPGIEELLATLTQQGFRLSVATSKPEHFANIILDRFGLKHYFSNICGTIDDNSAQKKDVLARLLPSLALPPSRLLMVGDRMHDVLGAKHWGIACVGVLYGYGTQAELVNAGAFAVVRTVAELKNFLLSEKI
jgi:phosphoglycolate phosphatase